MVFKHDWEKAHTRHNLPNKLIKQMVAEFYPDKVIKKYTIISGGCANINIKVEITNLDDPILLRIYIRNPDSAFIEKKIANKLKGELPIPKIFHIGKISEYTFAIAEFMPGITLRDYLLKNRDGDIEDVMFNIGKILGKVATITFDKSGFFNKDLTISEPFNQAGFLEYCLDALEHPNIQSVFSTKEQHLLKNLIKNNSHLFPDEEEKNLVHADFDPANILVISNNDKIEISAILDWEFSYSGSTITDIANMLRYSHHMPSIYKDGFINGILSSGYQLPSKWQKTMHLLNLMSLLDSLIRTKLEDRPIQVKDIKELVHHILATFDSKAIK